MAAAEPLSPRLAAAGQAGGALGPHAVRRGPRPRRRGPAACCARANRVLVNVRFDRGAARLAAALRAAGARSSTSAAATRRSPSPRSPASSRDLAAVPARRRRHARRGRRSLVAAEAPCDVGESSPRATSSCASTKRAKRFDLAASGVTVGVLSDSYDVATEAADGSGPVATHAHEDVASGDLPGPPSTCCGQQTPVNVLDEEPEAGRRPTDEGRAMLQIVHDLAPGAELAFATAFEGEESFAENIEALAGRLEGGAGAQVIVDDVAYFEEPFFQDGPVAVAVNKVTAEAASPTSPPPATTTSSTPKATKSPPGKRRNSATPAAARRRVAALTGIQRQPLHGLRSRRRRPTRPSGSPSNRTKP